MLSPPENAELPKSLQSLIGDAKAAIADWGSTEDADDPELMQFMRDWTERLSRGEFEDYLYWECVAEDCEELGDWEGAKAAYSNILDGPSIHYWKALSTLGSLQHMLGEHDAALKSFASAAKSELPKGSVLWRHTIVKQAWQLLLMARVRQAQRLTRSGLSTLPRCSDDYLGQAKLYIAAAACHLASNKTEAAQKALSQAWELLESLRATLEVHDQMHDALGVHYTYGVWWRVEATRRRLSGEGGQEIAALECAVEKARFCAGPSGWPRWDFDLELMRTLVELTAAFERQGRTQEAAATRAEAEALRIRRHFPETACIRWLQTFPPTAPRTSRMWEFIKRTFQSRA
jgi:tetratricopeptide (TPR) repeat protein